ncbi:hypothetical protein BGX21_011055 [Mortierella sp. AD011]|nr:hypothetical protein BGX21_011055 [Mortierella sp. AD011]
MYSPNTLSYGTLDPFNIRTDPQLPHFHGDFASTTATYNHQELPFHYQQNLNSAFAQLPSRLQVEHSLYSTFTTAGNSSSSLNIRSSHELLSRGPFLQAQQSHSSSQQQSSKGSIPCIDDSTLPSKGPILISALSPQVGTLSTSPDAAAAMGSENGSSTFSNTGEEGYFIVQALHEYRTDSPEHLSFDQFQYIKVTRCDVSGWWHGESENRYGWFPSNRVERVNHVYETEYPSRPTSITSEDYDQIRTGLDGVETQFLGEPVTDSASDGIQMDWTTNPPSIRRTRAGQLAFPPSRISVSQSYYTAGSPTGGIESHQHTMFPPTGAENDDVSFEYSDFATAVALHVKELREATSKREIERYRPIVIGILSFVRDLLIATNTIARDSEVLKAYPELSVLRQDVLRALGNLYSKCEVADGTRPGMSMKKRRFAVEKLGFFGNRVLTGVTEFTNYAQEIGLSMRSMSSPLQQEELEFSLISPTKSTEGVTPRARRRVSRANSAKGYKSFNAVRQWKAEHFQKFNAAKKAVELLQTEYMEYLNVGAGASSLNQIITSTIHAAQVVKVFLVSAEEIKAKTNSKEDSEYAVYRSRLSSALVELFGYTQVIERTAWPESEPIEIILNKFMNMAAFLWGCLVDLDVHSRSSQTHELSQSRRTSSSDPSATPDAEVAAGGNSRQGSRSTAATNISGASELDSRATPSRNTAPPRPRNADDSVGPLSPLSRKYVSLNDLSDRYKQQAGRFSPDEEVMRQIPESKYGEGNELERDNMDLYRSNHDSAVVITSVKGIPHHSLKTGYKGPTAVTPTVVEEEIKKQSLPSNPQPPQPPKIEHDPNETGIVIKGAEVMVTTIIVPTVAMSQLVEETISPTGIKEQPMIGQDTETSQTLATESLHPLDSKPPIAPSRSPKLSSTPRTSRSPAGRRRSSARTDYSRPSTDLDMRPSEDQNIVGLGVTVPSEVNPKDSSSAVTSQGSTSISRSSGIARARSPIPSSSPRPESSRRMQRPDHSPNPNSPNLGPESRTFPRRGSNPNNSLSPALVPGSRRGSQNSLRSDVSGRRRSNDSQISRDNDSRHENDRRRPSSRNGPRRGSNSGASVRAEPLANDQDVFVGPSAPSTPNIQTFVDNNGQQKTTKGQRRESVMSNLSVATEASAYSRTGVNPRAPSPALRNRNNQQDANTKGRMSTESNMSVDRQQHHQQPQQAKSGSGAASYRPRQNKVGQAKGRASIESKNETEALTTPWYLENDYEPDEVLYNESGTLVAASLDAYIEMLTSHKSTPDASFVTTFFTTFRLFTSPVELVDLLKKRFVKPPPQGLDENEVLAWQQQKQERIQKRVHIALKTWLEGYWVSEKDRAAFKPIMDFVSQDMATALPGQSSRLSEMLNQWAKKRKSLCLNDRPQTLSKSKSDDRLNQTAQDQNHANPRASSSSTTSRPFASVKEKYSIELKNTGKRSIHFGSRDSTQSRGPPVPLINKALLTALSNDQTMAKVPVTDIKAVELARQLTVLLSNLFKGIPYLELLGKERPNCSRMAQMSNKITIWVTDTIVDELDIKKRVGIIKHWIEVGEECLKLNNFDTLTAISCAIESTPVKRLHNTWESINKSYYERSLQLKKMVSSDYNYSLYRAKLKSIRAPCIPFLGLYFTVIAYIEDGNSLYKDSNSMPSSSASSTTSSAAPNTPTPTPARKLLRYGRFEKLAKQVQEFRDFQGDYELLEVPRLREYIMKCMENLDSERSYRKSLAIEPRKPQAPPGSGANGNGAPQRTSAGSNNHRASGMGRGLFHGGISNSEMGSNSMPAKLNKLSFFRKSTRTERS